MPRGEGGRKEKGEGRLAGESSSGTDQKFSAWRRSLAGNYKEKIGASIKSLLLI